MARLPAGTDADALLGAVLHGAKPARPREAGGSP
jgi:hypothetical protein